MREVGVIDDEVEQSREVSFRDVLKRLGRFHHGLDSAEGFVRDLLRILAPEVLDQIDRA